MFGSKAADALGRGHEAHEANAGCARALERSNGGGCATAGREHGIEQEEVALGWVAGHFEVIVDGLERIVVAVQPNVSDAGAWNQAIDAFDHTETGSEDRNERQFLSADSASNRALEWSRYRCVLERE